jgi:hypothetical protein
MLILQKEGFRQADLLVGSARDLPSPPAPMEAHIVAVPPGMQIDRLAVASRSILESFFGGCERYLPIAAKYTAQAWSMYSRDSLGSVCKKAHRLMT